LRSRLKAHDLASRLARARHPRGQSALAVGIRLLVDDRRQIDRLGTHGVWGGRPRPRCAASPSVCRSEARGRVARSLATRTRRGAGGLRCGRCESSSQRRCVAGRPQGARAASVGVRRAQRRGGSESGSGGAVERRGLKGWGKGGWQRGGTRAWHDTGGRWWRYCTAAATGAILSTVSQRARFDGGPRPFGAVTPLGGRGCSPRRPSVAHL